MNSLSVQSTHSATQVITSLVRIFKPEDAYCEIATAQLTFADNQDRARASYPFLVARDQTHFLPE